MARRGKKKPRRATLADRITDLAFRAMIGAALVLPYRWRVPLAGWLVAHVLAPVAGFRRRIRDNLALAMPDLPESDVRRLTRSVPDNLGRTIAEIYSGRAFIDRVRDVPLTGPGAAALEAARAAGRPVILVTGHFGNYDAARAALIARGYPLGGLYRPMKNPAFNAHYVRAIETIGKPLFPRGKKGLSEMVRHLRAGGMLGIVMDQHMGRGEVLSFFGVPAMTATSAADLALKYGAELIPIYAIRQPDGLDFELRVEAPIPPGEPRAMTQALNDSLEALVRDHMDQWLWIHRRWKRR